MKKFALMFVFTFAVASTAFAGVRMESQQGFDAVHSQDRNPQRRTFSTRQVQQPVDTYNNLKEFNYDESMAWKDDFEAEGPTLSSGQYCLYKKSSKPWVQWLPACEVTLTYTEPTIQAEAVGSRGFSHIDQSLPKATGKYATLMKDQLGMVGNMGNQLHHLLGFAHVHMWGLTPQDRFDSSASDMQAKKSLSCDLAHVWETWDNLNKGMKATPEIKLASSSRTFLVDSLVTRVHAWFPGSKKGEVMPELFNSTSFKEGVSQLKDISNFAGSMNDTFELITHAGGFDQLVDLAERIDDFDKMEETIKRYGGIDNIGKIIKAQEDFPGKKDDISDADLEKLIEIIKDSGGADEFKGMVTDAGGVKELQEKAGNIDEINYVKPAIEDYGAPEYMIQLVDIGGNEEDVIASYERADKLRRLFVSEENQDQWIGNKAGEVGGLCGLDGVYRPGGAGGRSGEVGDLTDVVFDEGETCSSEIDHTWPVTNTQKGDRISSGYGMRTHPVTGGKKMHKGIDISEGGACGSDIVASAAGKVTKAGRASGYGLVVYIQHADGGSTRYGHLASLSVAQGQQVSQGQLIGKMGTTGRSTGCHLHYETRNANGQATNPYPCIKDSRGKSLNNDVETAAGSGGMGEMPSTHSGAGQQQTAMAPAAPGQAGNMCIGMWDSVVPHTGFYPGTGRRGVGLALVSWRAYDWVIAKGLISPLKIQQGTAPRAVGYELTEFNVDYPYKTENRYPIGTDPLEWESPDEGRQNRATTTYEPGTPEQAQLMRSLQDGMISTYWKETSCTITYCCNPHIVANKPVIKPVNKAWLIKDVKDIK